MHREKWSMQIYRCNLQLGKADMPFSRKPHIHTAPGPLHVEFMHTSRHSKETPCNKLSASYATSMVLTSMRRYNKKVRI